MGDSRHRFQSTRSELQYAVNSLPAWIQSTDTAQDACHLRNAQGVHVEPRQLLEQVENLELVEIGDAAQCCGSAGTYNIDQPEIAASLGKQKIEAIAETGASIVVSGNIGCITQMKFHEKQRRSNLHILGSSNIHADLELPNLKIRHTMELIADALS